MPPRDRHTDLKPENLLFRSKADDAALCVADFGVRAASACARARVPAPIRER